MSGIWVSASHPLILWAPSEMCGANDMRDCVHTVQDLQRAEESGSSHHQLSGRGLLEAPQTSRESHYVWCSPQFLGLDPPASCPNQVLLALVVRYSKAQPAAGQCSSIIMF